MRALALAVTLLASRYTEKREPPVSWRYNFGCTSNPPVTCAVLADARVASAIAHPLYLLLSQVWTGENAEYRAMIRTSKDEPYADERSVRKVSAFRVMWRVV